MWGWLVGVAVAVVPPAEIEAPAPEVDDLIFEEAHVCPRDSDEIFIRNVILFQPGSDVLDAEASDMLGLIARLLTDTAAIGHMVIEGTVLPPVEPRAFELAEARARRVWMWLLEHGISERRLSYRVAVASPARVEVPGMQPIGESVRFDIVEQIGWNEPIPAYPAEQQLPYDGRTVAVARSESPDGWGGPYCALLHSTLRRHAAQ